MGIKENDWDSYFFEGEEVLKNKLDIHDAKKLKVQEYEIVTRKNALLYLSTGESDFSVDHLKWVHRYLFEDIYPFAGEYRVVNMGKDHRASFTDYREIDQNLRDILADLDEKILSQSRSDFLYAEALARVYWLLLEIHPFREGNGRTIREFMREYVVSRNKYIQECDYELDFRLSEEDKAILDSATKQSTLGYLVLVFNKLLKRYPKYKEEIKLIK